MNYLNNSLTYSKIRIIEFEVVESYVAKRGTAKRNIAEFDSLEVVTAIIFLCSDSII